MSQQINLLQHRRRPVGSAVAALAVVALLLLSMGAYDSLLRQQTATLKHDIEAGQRQLVQAKSALQALQQRPNRDDEASTLKAEIDTLKSKLEAFKQRGELIDNRTLGSQEGYAQHFTTLAQVSEDGLWLTSIFVGDAGKLVSLGGRSLHSESVLRYARRLNEAFTAQQVQFNAVEMTQESLVRSAEPDKPLLNTVAFRLY